MSKNAVLILAGGRSERMDAPKPWLEFRNGLSFLEHLINVYLHAGVEEIVVVLNSDFYDEARYPRIEFVTRNAVIVKNDHQDLGRMHSIKIGLQNVKADQVFIQNVDSPFISAESIKEIARHGFDEGTVIPTANGRKGHPVLLGADVLKWLRNQDVNEITLKQALNNFEQKLVETSDENILINVNTQEDYKRFSERSVQ